MIEPRRHPARVLLAAALVAAAGAFIGVTLLASPMNPEPPTGLAIETSATSAATPARPEFDKVTTYGFTAEYGVPTSDVDPGHPVILKTVVAPFTPGQTDLTYQWNTVIVDAETGDPLGSFSLPGPAPAELLQP